MRLRSKEVTVSPILCPTPKAMLIKSFNDPSDIKLESVILYRFDRAEI